MTLSTARIGSTGSGKTFAALRTIVASVEEAAIIADPTTNGSLARPCVTHLEGNVLYDNLSDNEHSPGYTLLEPSLHPDPEIRADINERKAEAFVPILMRRQDRAISSTPLKEEWIMGAILLFLFQTVPQLLSIIPFAFMPGTPEFERLVNGCTLSHISRMFRQLAKLTLRGLRAEVGSAARLFNSIFRTRTVRLRSRGGFHLGSFLQNKGKLIIERGAGVSEDVTRTITGAIILAVIDHAEKRPKPFPPIRIYVDESVTAGILGAPEILGTATSRKYGLSWDLLDQLGFPGATDAVLQNCKRHEWFGCSSYELARRAAVDIVAGLSNSGGSRAELIATVTEQILRMSPGHRWVRDPSGSRFEYVPMLPEPYPDWPGLRAAKLQEKLQWIYSRTEYRKNVAPPSETGSPPETPPRDKSLGDSFAAKRLKRRAKKRRDGSANNESEDGSTREDS